MVITGSTRAAVATFLPTRRARIESPGDHVEPGRRPVHAELVVGAQDGQVAGDGGQEHRPVGQVAARADGEEDRQAGADQDRVDQVHLVPRLPPQVAQLPGGHRAPRCRPQERQPVEEQEGGRRSAGRRAAHRGLAVDTVVSDRSSAGAHTRSSTGISRAAGTSCRRATPRSPVAGVDDGLAEHPRRQPAQDVVDRSTSLGADERQVDEAHALDERSKSETTMIVVSRPRRERQCGGQERADRAGGGDGQQHQQQRPRARRPT